MANFSNKSRLLQVLNDDRVNEFVLGYRLHHQHPLLPQVSEDLGNVDVDVVIDAV